MHTSGLVIVTVLSSVLQVVYSTSQPNIIFIVADDLGWNDVGFRNPEVKTPNIDKLASEGVILNNSYVQPWCSPSRSAFMSGYYPFHTGLQDGVIHNTRPYGLPLNLTTLPQRLQSLGYTTHMLGKWHLGFCNWDYTPTYRGFDTFYGYYSGAENYYTKMQGAGVHGYDFRDNKRVAWECNGTYSSYLYGKRGRDIILNHPMDTPMYMYMAFQSVHMPLMVPKIYENMYLHIKNETRRIFSGMVTAMDDAVGNITEALKVRGMMNNTLIVFTTDNGGPARRGANNWPLRGAKTTLWEGGTRGTAFVWGEMLKKKKYTNNNLMHAVDWYPTLVVAAGGETETDTDGIDQWEAITQNAPTQRKEMVYNIDDVLRNSAIRVGDYKLILGRPGRYNDWYPVPDLDSENIECTYDDDYECIESNDTYLKKKYKPQLFNLKTDPTEHYNLAQEMPAKVKELQARLDFYKKSAIPAKNPGPVRAANPKYFGGAWSPGWC